MKEKVLTGLVLLCFFLSACSGRGGQTPAPLPTVMLGNNSDSTAGAATPDAGGTAVPAVASGATASGVLITDQQIDLAFQAGGSVKAVPVTIGQSVKAGDVLVELDDEALQIQLEQANLMLNELTSPLAISNAQKAVAEDQSKLNNAQGTYNWWIATRSNENLVTKAQADLVVAQNDQKEAQDDYDKVDGELNTDHDKAAAYQRLYDAQLRVKQAQYQLDLYVGADPYQLAQDKAAVDVAKATLADDQTLLAALTGGNLPEHPTGTGYAQLMQARLNVRLAETNLKSAQLVSPIAGIVASVKVVPGDFASPGQVLVVVIDLKHLHVETTDLSERDVPGIKVGQAVNVTIKSLNHSVRGKVSAISPLADTLGGDVVYKVLVQIDSLPEGALAGMSVTVDFKGQ